MLNGPLKSKVVLKLYQHDLRYRLVRSLGRLQLQLHGHCITLYRTVMALFIEALPSSFGLQSTRGSEKPVKPGFGGFTRLCYSGLQGRYSHEAEAVLTLMF